MDAQSSPELKLHSPEASGKLSEVKLFCWLVNSRQFFFSSSQLTPPAEAPAAAPVEMQVRKDPHARKHTPTHNQASNLLRQHIFWFKPEANHTSVNEWGTTQRRFTWQLLLIGTPFYNCHIVCRVGSCSAGCTLFGTRCPVRIQCRVVLGSGWRRLFSFSFYWLSVQPRHKTQCRTFMEYRKHKCL